MDENEGIGGRPEHYFCVRTKREREDRGWTQQELALRLGDYGIKLHASAIAKIEAGTRALRLNEAQALAGVFGKDVDEMARLPSSEWLEAVEVFRQALQLHRDARLLEHKGFDLIRAIGGDFGRPGYLMSAHPSMQQPMIEILAALEEFGPGGSDDADG